MSDEQAREDFLSAHFLTVSGVIDDAVKCQVLDRVVVLCDMNDESGATFATFLGSHGMDSVEVDTVWVAHFSRRVLALLLDASWPSLERVIAALRSDECYDLAVLVISHGGAQLRFTRKDCKVPA